MKSIMKNFVSFSLCVLLAFGSFVSINLKCFAALEDIPIQGGSYAETFYATEMYKDKHPEDQTEYECHHLISKEALNRWGEKIKQRGLANKCNEFLVNDMDQNWAPSIVMEKADHEKTLSYFNLNTRNDEENQQAFDYIRVQANRIIYFGDIWGALNDEFNYIRETFGNKYDEALKQAFEYAKFYLFIRTNYDHLVMRNPVNPRFKFIYKFV